MAVTTKKCSILERYIRSCRVRIEIKHRYRVLSQNKISVPVRVSVISTRALIHTHRTRTNILCCDKTRVPMFYFLNQKQIKRHDTCDIFLKNKLLLNTGWFQERIRA